MVGKDFEMDCRMDMRKVVCVLFLAVCAFVFAGGPGPIPTDPVGFAGDTDSGRRSGIIDKVTRALVSIDYDHHELHEGTAFMVSSSSVALNTGQTFTMLLVTNGSPDLLHVVNEMQSTGEGTITFLENSTVVASGAEVQAFCRRRPSNSVCQCKAYIGPTFTGGTVLREFRSGAGKNTGGSIRASSEWILKPHSAYIVRFTAQANGIYVELKSDWYEHEDKN